MSTEELRNSIERNINSHIDEPKLLDEWYLLINGELPRSRRMTQREIAHLFLVFRKTGRFNVKHLKHSYSFHPIA